MKKKEPPSRRQFEESDLIHQKKRKSFSSETKASSRKLNVSSVDCDDLIFVDFCLMQFLLISLQIEFGLINKISESSRGEVWLKLDRGKSVGIQQKTKMKMIGIIK